MVYREVRQTNINTPHIFEFAGTPNESKDTLTGMIKELAKNDEWVYKTIKWAVANLHEAAHAPRNYDFIILNRGIFDRFSFLCAAREQEQITAMQYEIYETHVNYLLRHTSLQDSVLLFLVTPEELAKREMEKVSARNFADTLFHEDICIW